MKYLSVLIPFMLFGCVSIEIDSSCKDKALHHVVLCWLKESGNVEARERIVEVTKTFQNIPGVLEARAGRVIPSDRSIVDDSFDVGILVVVADSKSLTEYLEHPIHQKAKNEVLVPLVSKILVYDFQK
jgi:hypothetical protein